VLTYPDHSTILEASSGEMQKLAETTTEYRDPSKVSKDIAHKAMFFWFFFCLFLAGKPEYILFICGEYQARGTEGSITSLNYNRQFIALQHLTIWKLPPDQSRRTSGNTGG